MQQAQDLSQMTLADVLAGATSTARANAPKKEQPFTNYTMYSAKDMYLGNFSLPDNFSEVTKASIMQYFENKGIKLLTPGATKRDITLDELE